MSVSTVGAAGGASELVEVDHDEAPLAVQPASEGAQTGSVSGFDDAKAQTLVLNPQAPLLEIDRSADTQGKKKGTNDDSIGDGRTGGTRPADVIPTMVAKGRARTSVRSPNRRNRARGVPARLVGRATGAPPTGLSHPTANIRMPATSVPPNIPRIATSARHGPGAMSAALVPRYMRSMECIQAR